MTETTTGGIHAAIPAIMGELAQVGVAKLKRQGAGVSYAFRSIDQIQQALCPLLAKHGVTITPRILSEDRAPDTRQTKAGATWYYVRIVVEYTLRHSDGSSYVGSAYGEGQDNGDKAYGKAMSYAFKNFCVQAFCIPTEGADDTDGHDHEDTQPVDPSVLPFLDAEEAAFAINAALTNAQLDHIVKRLRASTLSDDDKDGVRALLSQQAAQIRGGSK